MAKEVKEESPVVDTPANDMAVLKAQIQQLMVANAQMNQLLTALITNKSDVKQEETKTRHEVLLEMAERKSENLRILTAKVEQDLADGPRKFFVSMIGEPMMQRKVGAEDEANAELKWKRYHGIRAVTEAEKQIIVTPWIRANEEALPSRIKDALSIEIPKIVT